MGSWWAQVTPPAVVRVSADTTVVEIRAETLDRLSLKLVNDSEYGCKFKYGAGCSADDFSWPLDPGERWEMPMVMVGGFSRPEYSGIITAIWESAQGAMQVTEIVTS